MTSMSCCGAPAGLSRKNVPPTVRLSICVHGKAADGEVHERARTARASKRLKKDSSRSPPHDSKCDGHGWARRMRARARGIHRFARAVAQCHLERRRRSRRFARSPTQLSARHSRIRAAEVP
eukprot:scaffold105107_cov25-Tisochrysis_lutea.AAC.3